MENILPSYKRPIHRINDPVTSVENWDKAMDAFDAKNYRQSVIEVLNYINSNLLKGKDLTQDIDIAQMQGSAEISIKLTDTHFEVNAPFIKMTEATNTIALQRKIAEVNFSPLTLVQIHKHDNEFWFHYKEDIELCQPYKVYDILREVCVYADDYDDIFIDKYKADFYKAPKVTPLSDSEKSKVWQQIETVLNDYKAYAQFFKEKRWDEYVWDLVVICTLKLSNMPYVHGKLRSDLVQNVGTMFNSNIQFNDRISKGKKFMESVLAMSQDEIMKDVYHADQLQSVRWRSSPKIIQDRLMGYEKQVNQYVNNESYFNLSYYLQFVLLKLMYDYNLEQDYKNAIHDALEAVSGKEPMKAYKTLVNTYYNLLDGKIRPAKKEKKGFFSKLFS